MVSLHIPGRVVFTKNRGETECYTAQAVLPHGLGPVIFRNTHPRPCNRLNYTPQALQLSQLVFNFIKSCLAILNSFATFSKWFWEIRRGFSKVIKVDPSGRTKAFHFQVVLQHHKTSSSSFLHFENLPRYVWLRFCAYLAQIPQIHD